MSRRQSLTLQLAILTTLALLPAPGRALETPRLLADIVPGDSTDTRTSSPGGFLRLGDRLIFSTLGATIEDDAILWVTDGTAEGTLPLTSRICPLACEDIRPLGTVGGVALFAARPGRVWRTDGTPAGTFPLGVSFDAVIETAKISPDAGVLYFTACDAQSGCELWRSDGTRAGTRIVRDIVPGTDGSNPHALTPWRGRLYFLAGGASDADSGLWGTDGTAAGTRFIAPSLNNSENGDTTLTATPTRLFFTSLDVTEQLWTSDGTPSGSRLIRRFAPPPCPQPSSCPVPYLRFLEPVPGNAVIFTASDGVHGSQIWESAGTHLSTRPLTAIRGDALGRASIPQRPVRRWVFSAPRTSAQPTPVLWTADIDFAQTAPAPLTGCAGGCPEVQFFFPAASGPAPRPLLFAGRDPIHGTEVWSTDGTPAGTRRLTDVCPGPCPAFSPSSSVESTVLGSDGRRTWFLAQPVEEGADIQDLWVSDGTPAGTRRVSGYARGVGFLGGQAFFGATGTDGLELRTTDGSAAGSHTVAVLQRTPAGSFPEITSLGTFVVMRTSEGDIQRLWRSDGTPAGTAPIPGFALSLPQAHFANVPPAVVAGQLFFEVDRASGGGAGTPSLDLWRTDGTGPGTRQLASFGAGQGLELGTRTIWNGVLLFTASRGEQCAFWTSDGTTNGTAAGTREILPLPTGARCPDGVTAFGSRFLFVARATAGGESVPQLYVSDGTPAGTRQLSSFQQTRSGVDPQFALLGSEAFFQVLDPSGEDVEIWRTDGTPEGTQPFFPGILPQAFGLTAWNGALYLSAYTGEGGQPALVRWAPGDPAPVTLATVDLGFNSGYSPQIPPFVGVRFQLFFVARDALHGFELWATDGTAAGTRLVRDIQAGPLPSSPRNLTPAQHLLFFTADDGEHGRELWVSDNTTAGTRIVADLDPGGFSSHPSSLAVGFDLFFAADDGTTGVEPWVLPLPNPPPP